MLLCYGTINVMNVMTFFMGYQVFSCSFFQSFLSKMEDKPNKPYKTAAQAVIHFRAKAACGRILEMRKKLEDFECGKSKVSFLRASV